MSRLLWTLLLCASAQALPLYTARGGSTCDNCHSLPNHWENPELAQRKCTMSCVGCHVDPNGGGLRTVSGDYYGRSTLPMFLATDRPLADARRSLLDFAERVEAEVPSSQPLAEASKSPAKQPEGSNEMAWLQGRYGDLDADPLLNLGADARLGFWSAGPLFFPMQADAYAAVHPVEHFTLSTSIGARGRSRSLTFDGMGVDEQPRFGVRDLWAMLHELPYLTHVRVGRFLPAFGTRVSDHTAYVRRPFGLSQEDPANRVLGVEVGMAPNYPYVTASVFKPSTRDAVNPVGLGDGFGAALSAGWRDLGWQLGASGMIRNAPLDEGGRRLDASLQWGFNPWFYLDWLPLTYLGEVAGGAYQRPYSGYDTLQVAWYHQLAWTAANGVVVRGRYDTHDPVAQVADDAVQRLGLDLHFLPGLTLSVDGRVGLPERKGGGEGEGAADLFVQLHGWL